MANRNESRETILARICSVPPDSDFKDDDGDLFTEEFKIFCEEFAAKCKAEPDDTVLKLMNEARLFED